MAVVVEVVEVCTQRLEPPALTPTLALPVANLVFEPSCGQERTLHQAQKEGYTSSRKAATGVGVRRS